MATATTTIEERVARIEARLDSFATKEDLAKLEARLTCKMAGLQIGAMVAIAAILRFLS